MADIFDRRGSVSEGDGRPLSSAGDFEELPRLSRLMIGEWSDANSKWKLPPHSLIAWAEGSIIKFLFNAGEKEPRLFGSTSGLSHGLKGIEAALANGQCEWKPPKGAKRS